jgi:hypothetical protein
MPELTAILMAKRESEYQERKFFAAIQGVDLEASSENGKGQKEWEDMKARVFSGGKAKDSNDIVSLQGQSAAQAGFGIGKGLEYSSTLNKNNPKNPMS